MHICNASKHIVMWEVQLPSIEALMGHHIMYYCNQALIHNVDHCDTASTQYECSMFFLFIMVGWATCLMWCFFHFATPFCWSMYWHVNCWCTLINYTHLRSIVGRCKTKGLKYFDWSFSPQDFCAFEREQVCYMYNLKNQFYS